MLTPKHDYAEHRPCHYGLLPYCLLACRLQNRSLARHACNQPLVQTPCSATSSLPQTCPQAVHEESEITADHKPESRSDPTRSDFDALKESLQTNPNVVGLVPAFMTGRSTFVPCLSGMQSCAWLAIASTDILKDIAQVSALLQQIMQTVLYPIRYDDHACINANSGGSFMVASNAHVLLMHDDVGAQLL